MADQAKGEVEDQGGDYADYDGGEEEIEDCLCVVNTIFSSSFRMGP